MSVSTLEPTPVEEKLPWRKRTNTRRVLTGFLAGGVAAGALVFGGPVLAPEVNSADAAPCRTVVVPGAGAVSKSCGTPLPEGAKKCAGGIISGAAAGAATAGKKGAIGGAAGGVGACLMDAIDG